MKMLLTFIKLKHFLPDLFELTNHVQWMKVERQVRKDLGNNNFQENKTQLEKKKSVPKSKHS